MINAAAAIDAITTAPLHKAALWQAGHHYPGHTELLAELCGVSDFAMMLYLPPDAQIRGPAGLGVVHVTLHMALRNVFAAITVDAVEATVDGRPAATGAALPVSLGNIAPSGTATATITFPSSAGADGAATSERYSGTYTGGSFTATMRAVLP